MRTAHLSFLERDEQTETQDLLAKIPFIELIFEHGLVKMLELRERKLRRQQFETDRFVTHLAFEPGHPGRENSGMVEGQLRHLRERKPTGVSRVGSGFGLV